VARRLVGHLVRGKFAEFLVDEREQFLGGFSFALLHAVKDARDIAHGRSLADGARMSIPKRSQRSKSAMANCLKVAAGFALFAIDSLLMPGRKRN